MNKVSRTYSFVKKLPLALNELRQNLYRVEESVSLLKKGSEKATEQVREDLQKQISILSQKQSDLLHRLSLEQPSPRPVKQPSSYQTTSALQADNHQLDSYYRAFEEKFRGSEEDIYKRLKKAYGKVLSVSPKTLLDETVIDIGCGRGELLKLYKEFGIKALGLDLNQSMVERCIELGYEAKQADALLYLKGLESSSIAGVSGIHFVEHIPFESLYVLLNECFRVLKPGGFILFETPNPENITVGAFSFWYDSSHLKPVPPDVLQFVAQYTGFNEAEIIRLHPVPNSPVTKSSGLQQVFSRINGPRDYAVFARKTIS